MELNGLSLCCCGLLVFVVGLLPCGLQPPITNPKTTPLAHPLSNKPRQGNTNSMLAFLGSAALSGLLFLAKSESGLVPAARFFSWLVAGLRP